MSKWETEFRFVMFLILICIYENIFQDSHSRNSVSERFLAAENQRARELERLIDSHIEQLKIGTEATLRKYNVKRWCHLLLWCNLFLCSVHLMRTGWFSAAKQEISVIYHTKCNLYNYMLSKCIRETEDLMSRVWKECEKQSFWSAHSSCRCVGNMTANETSWKWRLIPHVWKHYHRMC